MCFDFVSLLWMACQAWTHKRPFQFEIQGCVGIGVATPAIFQFIMGLTTMTHVASRNSVSPLRRMFYMTIHTANLCLVFRSTGCDCFGLLRMAMHALGIE
jgi:hypothetical protein